MKKIQSAAYYFSLAADLEATDSSGQGPGGQRIYVEYKPGPNQVTTDLKLYHDTWGQDFDAARTRDSAEKLGLDWPGLTAQITSGGDFILLRQDGVLELDGRLTLKDTAKDSAGVLIDILYSGLIDLSKHPKATEVPICLHVTFETASGPWPSAEGEDLGWVKARYLVHEASFWKYQTLIRQPFLAIGTLEFREELTSSGSQSRPKKIAVDLLSLAIGDSSTLPYARTSHYPPALDHASTADEAPPVQQRAAREQRRGRGRRSTERRSKHGGAP